MIYFLLLFYMSIMFMFFIIMFLYFLVNKMTMYLEFEIIKIFSVKIEFLILMDWISLLFISVVLFISMMVILYSIEYMSEDLNINRFMLLLLMFVLSMMLMIMSPNIISILLGWDGLGLVSYCLVIYYQSVSSFNSGMITVLTNRIGDILILMSIGLLMSLGSWNIMFFQNIDMKIYFMLIIASCTKSAQIPFSSWLPMAMAAPTPVSSLVHSSTLVTAGVYLLIRLNYLLLCNNMSIVMLMSIMTMFLAGLGANFEYDLKKIIALSTLSQLGVMIFCLSMKLEEISFFHLLIHAMFKSLLFMCAGVIIHNMLNNQDIRYISMVLYNLPLVSMMFNCSSLSLCGIPFMSGFFSKDLILEMFLMNKFNKFILLLLFISMGLTVSYSVRLVYYSFIKIPQLIYYNNYFSLMSYMLISMYLLFMFSIISGSMLSWLLFSTKNLIFLTKSLKLLIYLFMFLGFILGNLLYKIFMIKIYLYFNYILKFFMMLWFMSLLYNYWLPKIMKFSNNLIYWSELGGLNYLTMGLNMFIMNFIKYEYFFKNYYYLMIIYMITIIFIIY